MALSKTFGTNQILTAEDVNTHMVHQVPNPGDPYTIEATIPFEAGYEPRAGYTPVVIRVGLMVFLQGFHVDGTKGDWSSTTVSFATIPPAYRPTTEIRFIAFRTGRAYEPFGGYISPAGIVNLQVPTAGPAMGGHFNVIAPPWRAE